MIYNFLRSWWYAIPAELMIYNGKPLIYCRFYAIIHLRRWWYENSSNIFMDYNLYNFCFRTFVLIYRFVGMVSNSRTTGKSTYNCYCYDGNTCYQRHYTVLDKKKVKILSFQAYLIRATKFKTPKRKSVLVRGRIFVCIIHYSFFIIHYSLTGNGFPNE